MHDPDAVLSFWFGTPTSDPQELGRKVRRWYAGGAELDREMAERFGSTLERALAGELDHWAEDLRGRLALILLLDQFTRNVYRNTARAYAGDARALRLALDTLDAGHDQDLNLEERLFLLSPLLHAEDVPVLARVIVEMERLVSDAPEEARHIYEAGLEQARKYHDVVSRFGRFPHRNTILDRTSTAEEIEFLRAWGQKAAPALMKQPRS